MYREKLNECRKDAMTHEKTANDAIINGDFVVKVLRVATGKNLGPGAYPTPANGIGQGQTSYNIKGTKQFQGLDSIGKSSSTILNKSQRDADKLVSSFYESAKSDLTKIFQSVNEPTKKVSSTSKPSMFQLNGPVWKNRHINISMGDGESQLCNQTSTTANESKDASKGRAFKRYLRTNSLANNGKVKSHLRKPSGYDVRKLGNSSSVSSPVNSQKNSCQNLVVTASPNVSEARGSEKEGTND